MTLEQYLRDGTSVHLLTRETRNRSAQLNHFAMSCWSGRGPTKQHMQHLCSGQAEKCIAATWIDRRRW